MPKTFNQLATDFTTLAYDSSGSTLALGKSLINIGARKMLNFRSFLEDSKTIASGTSIQYYDPPYNMDKLKYVHWWYGNVWYPLTEIKTEQKWRELNNVVVTSNVATYWFLNPRTKKVGIYPVSNTSKGTIEMGFTKKIRDMSLADYSTGSVTVASDGTVITGYNTVFNSQMVGRYLKVSETNTPADGFWFEISSFGSATQLNVKEAFPNAVSGGTYTISELVPLPDGSEDIPLWYALYIYFLTKEKPLLANVYKELLPPELIDSERNLISGESRTVTGIIERQTPIQITDVNRNPWSISIEE